MPAAASTWAAPCRPRARASRRSGLPRPRPQRSGEEPMALADIIRLILAPGHPAVGPPQPRPSRPSYGEERLARWQRVLADLGYPYILVPPAKVDETLMAEREIGAREGFSPVVVVPGLWNSRPMPAAKR